MSDDILLDWLWTGTQTFKVSMFHDTGNVFAITNPWPFWASPVHTTPVKIENAALFQRLCLLSTLIRHENALQTAGI